MGNHLLRNIILTLAMLVLTQAVFVKSGDDEYLPIGLTEEEMTRLDEIGINHIRTAPPAGPIRNCAEWEPSEGVIIRWPLGISIAIVAEMSEDVMVTTIVANSYEQNQAYNSYSAGGVNMLNVNFLIAPTNSIWTRDYGPWFIINGAGQFAIVDPIYNRPRPLDDQIPAILGSAWGMSVYGMALETPGGNHMSDGLGISMSTELVYDENPSFTPRQVDSIMFAYVGNAYDVLEYIEYGGIHHIDCWAKFLGPSTVLVKDVSSGNSSYDLLNDRAEYLANKKSSWGQFYNVVRVYCPYGTAYTNSLILNKKVLVPIFGSSYDTTTIRVYEEAMPGYEVLGFTGSWYDNDAIHCRAMGVPDLGMLSILHVPLTTTSDTLNDYLVSVRITPYSGSALISDSLKIYYQARTQYQSTPLYSTAVPDSFYGYIPAQPGGTEISYYIKAGDLSGRVETHPYIGESWAHKFYVNHPPEILSPDYFDCGTSTEFSYCPEYSDLDDSVISLSYYDFPDWLIVQNDSLVGTTPDSAVISTFTVEVSDTYSTVNQEITISVYRCGDANSDSDINVADAVFLINYVFKGGPAPEPMLAGDANSDGELNVADAVFIINYVFKSGSPPECP
jgi:agmatine/peptidylarginine deiminase